MTQNDARNALAGMGIEFSDPSFFKYLKAGDREVVELFLDSGLPPDVRDSDRNAAVVVATKAGQKDLARVLLARGASPEPLLNAQPSKKDAWDKLTASSAVLTFISGLLIAGIGGWFTYLNSQKQSRDAIAQAQRDFSVKDRANRIQELDEIRKLMPNLTSGDEKEKALALLAIQHYALSGFAKDITVQVGEQDRSGVLSRPSVISYVRDGTDNHGEFRRKGQVWIETYTDLETPREWIELPGAPREIRLGSWGAIIRIDLDAKAIYYSDGKTNFRRLDTVR